MKKVFVLILCGIIIAGSGFLRAQQEEKAPPERQPLVGLRSSSPSYDPAGRRDPFKNLLGGKEIKEKTAPGSVPQLYIDDIALIGIVKYKNRYTAILSGPQGFPYYFGVGEKLSDGFILSINETQVIFRKTNERGIPLTKPKDIIKEITPEER